MKIHQCALVEAAGSSVMSKNPQYLFSPQFFLLLLWNQLHACAAAVCALAKAKTLQEKTPEYISQH